MQMQAKLDDANVYINKLEKIIFDLRDKISNMHITQPETTQSKVKQPDYSKIIGMYNDIVETIKELEVFDLLNKKTQIKAALSKDIDYLDKMKSITFAAEEVGEVAADEINNIKKTMDIEDDEELDRVLKIIFFYVTNPFLKTISIYNETEQGGKYTEKNLTDYNFDEVFTTSSTDNTIANTQNVKSLLEMFKTDTDEGKNYIIFQYGLSGSGKTLGAKKIMEKIQQDMLINEPESDTLIYGKRGKLTLEHGAPVLKFVDKDYPNFTHHEINKEKNTLGFYFQEKVMENNENKVINKITIYNDKKESNLEIMYLNKSEFLKPTPFNKEGSSRGHRIHKYKKGNNNLYLCDLAGIEKVVDIIFKRLNETNYNENLNKELIQEELNGTRTLECIKAGEKITKTTYKMLDYLGRLLYSNIAVNINEAELEIYKNFILYHYIFPEGIHKQGTTSAVDIKHKTLDESRHRFDVIAESYFITHTLNELEKSLVEFKNNPTNPFKWNYYSKFNDGIKVEKILFNGFIKNSANDEEEEGHEQTLKFVSKLGEFDETHGGAQFGPNSQLPTNATDVSLSDTNTKLGVQPVNTLSTTEQPPVDATPRFDTPSLEQPVNSTDTTSNLNTTQQPPTTASTEATTSYDAVPVSSIDTTSNLATTQPIVEKSIDTTPSYDAVQPATTYKIDKEVVIENMVIDKGNEVTEQTGNFINKIINMDENSMFNLYLLSFIGINFAATQFALYLKKKMMEKEDFMKTKHKQKILTLLSMVISLIIAGITGATFIGLNNALIYIGAYALISSLDFFDLDEKYLDEDTDIEIYAWIIASIIFTFNHE